MSRRPAKYTQAEIRRGFNLANLVCPPGPYVESDVPSGHVYFIVAPKAKAIKIGYSKDPRTRFTNLDTGSPEPLEFYVSFHGYPEDEAAIHRKFKHLRTNGEWFRECRAIYNFLDDVAEEFEELTAFANDFNGLGP